MCDDDQLALSRRTLLRGGAALAITAPLLGAFPAAASAGTKKVLVFSRTSGYRHASIETGIETVRQLGAEGGFAVDATEDPAAFTTANLRQYAAVLFLNTTGTVLDTAEQKSALELFIRGGGGFVGVHAAADTEHEWPFYGELVGAYFHSHPIQQAAFLDNEAPDHPATAHLDSRFPLFDEFYSFKSNPRPDVRVLLTIDESTYLPDPNTTNVPFDGDCGPTTPENCEPKPIDEWIPGETGYMSGERGVPGDHPMSWCHNKFRGHAFYTALGHEAYLYDQDWFRQHLLGGILSATGLVLPRAGVS